MNAKEKSAKEKSMGATLSTPAVLEDPFRNRGVAFTPAERKELGLIGRLPSGVLTLEEQAQRAYDQLHDQGSDLAKNVYLEQLHDRNGVLYYKLLTDHLAELLPIVYDPTVGDAIEKYSHEYRRPRGIFLSIDEPDSIERAFATLHLGPKDVDLIVCSDAEEILGIGDWGWWIQISVGKLSRLHRGGRNRPQPCDSSFARRRNRQRVADERPAVCGEPARPHSRRRLRLLHREVPRDGFVDVSDCTVALRGTSAREMPEGSCCSTEIGIGSSTTTCKARGQSLLPRCCRRSRSAKCQCATRSCWCSGQERPVWESRISCAMRWFVMGRFPRRRPRRYG